MTIPLYQNNSYSECKDYKGNKGLLYDRFFNQYDEQWKIADEGKSKWLESCFHNKKVGDTEQLNHHTLQQKNLAETLKGNSHIFKADWHLVTGMGNTHPVENGFAWHPTLGVPYLTGAAVKGLVRSYIENYLDASPDEKKALLLNWFGSDDKAPEKQTDENQTGNLIFFDALPVEPVQLTVDIMTPHMGDWYKDGFTSPNKPNTVPADWHDPNPITFLATKGINLQFSYALRQYPENTSTETKPREAIRLEDVKKVLTLALKHMGAGGKTTTGYGVMSPSIKHNVWLKAKIVDLMNKHHAKEEDIWGGKSLAEEWRNITDGVSKQEALLEIKEYWQKQEWWEETPKGAKRKAKAIYTGNE